MDAFISRHYRSIFTVFLVLLLGLSFYVGYREGIREQLPQVRLACAPDTLKTLAIPLGSLLIPPPAHAVVPASIEAHGMFVGSKNGTKYYTPNCSGVNRIKPENYIWFSSAQDAQIQGYTPGSC